MRKMIFVPLIWLISAAPVLAQNQVYHDTSSPTGGSANTFPFGNAFGNNWRYQMSIPPSSLPNTPVRFTEVAFAPSTNGTFSVKDFQLRMAHATATRLSTVFASNFATPPVNLIDVQGGNYTFTATTGNWIPLGARNSFLYDGVSPLLIEIRYRGFGTMNQGSSSIRSYTSSTNSNRVRANGSYPSPIPPDPYSATFGRPGTSGAIRVCLTYLTTQLTLSGTTRPGGTVDLDCASPGDPSKPYQVASSLGTGPILLGTRTIGLTPDDLMVITTRNLLPSVFRNYRGTLDASGNAKAQINIINDTRLIGTRIHSAFITLDPNAPFGVKNISNTASFSITS